LKKLYGLKVMEIENRFGRPLEDILQQIIDRGLNFTQGSRLMGVSRATFKTWRTRAGIKKRPLTTFEDLMKASGLVIKEAENG
jgi:transposase-like protein